MPDEPSKMAVAAARAIVYAIDHAEIQVVTCDENGDVEVDCEPYADQKIAAIIDREMPCAQLKDALYEEKLIDERSH